MPGKFGAVWGFWPSGWTGGQYSILRVLLGGFLLSHFVQLSLWAWDLPSGLVLAVTLIAVVASLLFIVGIADKWAALFLGFALVFLYGLNPALPKASVTPLVWMLLAHLLMRKAPYGSLAARGRPDPGAGWRFPFPLVLGTWLLLAWSYLLAGHSLTFSPPTVAGVLLSDVFPDPYLRDYVSPDFLTLLPPFLVEALELKAMLVGYLFALFLMFDRIRVWFWCALFAMQLCLALLPGFAEVSIVLLLLHLFAFDPGWIRSRKPPERATLFYDGTCALCHRLARFVLAEDADGRITFSPLQSEFFLVAFTAEERAVLPDSIVLKSDVGLLLEGDAAIRILKMLGGLWLVLAVFLGAFPRRWRNAAYRFIGERRYRLFGRAETACPVVPPRLQSRFREKSPEGVEPFSPSAWMNSLRDKA